MPAYIDDLVRQAMVAAYAEADYRIQMRDRLEQLQSARIAAYRRLDLLRGMAGAIAAAADEAAALPAAVDHALRRAGWSDSDAAWAALRTQLMPVAAAVRAGEQPPTPDGPQPSPQAPILAFAAFESWYRARFDADFLSRMMDEVPAFGPATNF